MKWNRKSKPWQLQEAKARFSELYEKALTEGPQYVTRHGRDEIVISKRADFDRSTQETHIIDLLLAAPYAPDFKIHRSGSTGRKPFKFE